MRRRVGLILGVVLLLAVAGAVAGRRWWQQRAPYPPQTLHAQATLRFVDQATADAALAPGNAEHAEPGEQILLGRVSWTPPAEARAGDSFRIVLLDKRRRLMPGFIAATAADPADVGAGSDHALDLAEERYPWLRGIGAREINGGFWWPGSAVTASVDASPVTLQTVLHRARPGTPPEAAVATAPVSVDDLLVALIGVGPDGQVYWAQRLLN
ncbi:hypothetical protein BJY16_006734 [Actinoplanes octamycinicus]|uniref:Uncharacterized protein n=1 Tax=Actinoplanes octamycinicus TaxID=135948 RepID=A0A7W7H3G8_9ACTN|nr:hypothetical protein [Actinoplanes octamycinicus]MBB4743275.1 hypothetical protein [Actinoplanes octamycinicus]GIE61789.1 hypothetical protein Aoc01nite_71910 [Actinoplanes octamycinicus]